MGLWPYLGVPFVVVGRGEGGKAKYGDDGDAASEGDRACVAQIRGLGGERWCG